MLMGQSIHLFIYGISTALAAATPVFHQTPHAGSESTQYFSRGLELDFGTDFALEAGGIPLNIPSHIHGPGFLDTDLLIPELMGECVYTKGSYQADQTGFAVAGSASRDLASSLDSPLLKLVYGGAAADNYARVLWADHRRAARLTYGIDLSRMHRPWNQLADAGRINAAVRKDGEAPWGSWIFTALGSAGRSDSGAAEPSRPVPAETPDYKAGDGTQSQQLYAAWRLNREDEAGSSRFRIFGGSALYRRWNNWTYFMHDPVHGDQAEELDRRAFLGLDGARTWLCPAGSAEWSHTLGFELRADRVMAAEVHASQNRGWVIGGPVPAGEAWADLRHGALHGQTGVTWGGGWEAFLGLRLDSQENRANLLTGPWRPQNRSQTLGSPKAGLAFGPTPGTRFALQAGRGFRLGDAFREGQPMYRSTSVELSAQTRPADFWTASVTFWRLDLESEVLFNPSQNILLGQGPANHSGLEFFNGFKSGPWHGELVWGWNRASLNDLAPGQDRVPGFVPQTGYAGVGWKGRTTAVDLSVRRTGARPLTGDGGQLANAEDGFQVRVEQTLGRWSVAVEVMNALNRKNFNHEYYYLSQLPGEAAPVLDRHFKPADPQLIRLELLRRF